MPEEKVEKVEKVERLNCYTNKTKNNLFTEHGRIRPNQQVRITAAQAKKIKGLVFCKQ